MIDINKPITNPELVESIKVFQSEQTQRNEHRMLEQLKIARYLMVFEGELHHDTPDSNGRSTLQTGSTLKFTLLRDSSGTPLHFAFTDWPAVYKWNNKPNQKTFIVRFDDLSSMVLREGSDSSGVLINPGSSNLFLVRQQLAFMSGRANPQVIKKETKVQLGEPTIYPQALVDAVVKAIKPLDVVKKAWLMLMKKEGEQSYLIVVDHRGDRAKVSNTIGQAATPHLNGMFLDIVEAGGAFGMSATENRSPFFEREF